MEFNPSFRFSEQPGGYVPPQKKSRRWRATLIGSTAG